MIYINLTRVDITLNSGEVYPVSADHESANVKEVPGDFDGNNIATLYVDGMTDLPVEAEGVVYIVSRPYLAALRNKEIERNDVVCAATNHRDTIRDEKGAIVSVPGFYTF